MITIDSTSNGGIANTITSRTWNHTVGAGENRMLIVCAMARDSSGTGDENVLSITFGGVPLTQADSVGIVTGSLRNEIWYLPNPAVGLGSIVVTWSGTLQTGSAMAASFFGVSQTPTITSVDANAGTQFPTATLASGDLQIANTSADSSTSLTVDSGTQIFTNDGSRQHAASYNIGSSFQADFTIVTAAANWAEHIVGFTAAADGSVTVPTLPLMHVG